jgi:hypothetical protein
MFFKKKEQLHIGDFCPFAITLAKQVQLESSIVVKNPALRPFS